MATTKIINIYIYCILHINAYCYQLITVSKKTSEKLVVMICIFIINN